MSGVQFNARFFAVAAVLALSVITEAQGSWWISIVFSLGFCHYLLAFYYSKTRLFAFAGQTTGREVIALLSVATALLYFYAFPLVALFGVHHAINEAYMRSDGSTQESRLRPARAFLQLFAYLVILRGEFNAGAVPSLALWILLAFAVLYFAWGLRRGAPNGGLFANVCNELFILFFVLVSLWQPISFLQVVFYHFLVWTVAPIATLSARGSAALSQYAVLTVTVTGLFLVLSPLGLANYYQADNLFAQQFYFWSYLHIIFSFALSDSHPPWVVRAAQSAV